MIKKQQQQKKKQKNKPRTKLKTKQKEQNIYESEEVDKVYMSFSLSCKPTLSNSAVA